MVKPRIPELEECGCGVSLAFGTKIIAAVFLFLSGLGFLSALYVIISEELDSSNTDSGKASATYIEVIAVMGMVVSAIYGSLTAMLYLGVTQHNASLVLPWAIITTAFNFILTFIGLLVLFHHPIQFSVVVLWLIIVTLYYCGLIVYSHFRELRREQNLPQSLTNSEGA